MQFVASEYDHPSPRYELSKWRRSLSKQSFQPNISLFLNFRFSLFPPKFYSTRPAFFWPQSATETLIDVFGAAHALTLPHIRPTPGGQISNQIRIKFIDQFKLTH
jgi:hypothetical protein